MPLLDLTVQSIWPISSTVISLRNKMKHLIEQDVSIPRTGLVVISFEIKRAQVGAAILERYVDRPSEPESNPDECRRSNPTWFGHARGRKLPRVSSARFVDYWTSGSQRCQGHLLSGLRATTCSVSYFVLFEKGHENWDSVVRNGFSASVLGFP